jgi:hypothetical protein
VNLCVSMLIQYDFDPGGSHPPSWVSNLCVGKVCQWRLPPLVPILVKNQNQTKTSPSVLGGD